MSRVFAHPALVSRYRVVSTLSSSSTLAATSTFTRNIIRSSSTSTSTTSSISSLPLSSSNSRITSSRTTAPFSSSSSASSNVLPSGLVSSSWVAKHMPQIKMLDGSWFPPVVKEAPFGNFLESRIPTSLFFDIDNIADKRNTSHPHLFPTEQDFARIVGGDLGISEKDNVVVYDSMGVFSAPRVWFTFKAYGLDSVAVLDGGLPQWKRDGFPITTGPHVHNRPSTTFNVNLNKNMIKNYDDMLENIDTKKAQVLDARSAGRFEGVEAEPRPNMRSGHIPGAINVPFSLLKEDISGFLKPVPAIRQVFERAGVDLSNPDAPIICYCGSGITACFLAFGLNLVGHKNLAVYQGSWVEWGSRKDSPIETGAKSK